MSECQSKMEKFFIKHPNDQFDYLTFTHLEKRINQFLDESDSDARP